MDWTRIGLLAMSALWSLNLRRKALCNLAPCFTLGCLPTSGRHFTLSASGHLQTLVSVCNGATNPLPTDLLWERFQSLMCVPNIKNTDHLELASMLRSSRALILLAVFLWQSLAVLGSTNLAQRAGELEHLIAHCQDAGHHHHADQSLHMDDDDGPLQHLHADTNGNTTGLLTSLQLAVAGVRSMSPPEANHTVWLSPTLEGPLRPPMPRA